jgi:gluconolactonase
MKLTPVIGLLPLLIAQACSRPSIAWEPVPGSFQLTADSAVDNSGNVYFTDARTNRILKIGADGKPAVWKENTGGSHGIAAGPDGRLYAGQHGLQRIVAYSPDGRETVVLENVQTHHLVLNARNELYFADAPNHKIWIVDQSGQRRVVTTEVEWPHGMRLSPDQSLFFVTDLNKGNVWSFRIEPDGSLTGRTTLCRLENPGEAGGVAIDLDGAALVATTRGVQVCDASGNVTQVIQPPSQDGVTNLFFAGPNLEWLYVTDTERFYRRQWKR